MSQISDVVLLWQKVLVLLRASAPGLSILVTIVTLTETIMGLVALYSIKLLVDSIGSEINNHNNSLPIGVVGTLMMTGSAILLVAFFQSVGNILRMRQGLFVSDYVDREIHNRSISVGLKYYESPEYYDSLERAREGGTRRPAQIVANAVLTFRAAITIFGILFLLGAIEYKLLPALVIPIIVAMIIRIYFSRRLFKWRMSRAQRERRASYFDLIMTRASHAKDLRINGIGEFFRNKYSAIRKELRADEIEIEQARMWSEFSMAVLGAIVFVSVTLWLLSQTLDNSRPIGDVVLALLLLRRAEISGKDLVGNVSKIVDDHLYLQRLFNFLSTPIQSATCSEASSLPDRGQYRYELNNVSFKYEGAQVNALDGVSLEVNSGQIVALVGENGSGKTTLIKLLTRLYDPTSGSVTLNGKDIRNLNPHEYRRTISAVFQDYAMYAETVKENIRLGDLRRAFSQDSIKKAAQDAGASKFIEALPKSYATPLTKLFDNGQELSIGQWQRLSLARALYADSKLLILDEPTSAMDAEAEFALFENFRSRVGNRATLMISHRLSTVRQADYVYVLNGGKIAEHGSHDELLTARGIYARLFNKQAQHFR